MPNPIWIVAVEDGGKWHDVCCCFSRREAERAARYFKPMRCFSGKQFKVSWQVGPKR